MFNFLKNHNKRIIAIGIFITIMLTGAPIIVKSATTDTTRPTITAQPIAEGSSRTSGEMKLGTHPKFLIQDDTYITSIFYTWNKHFNENKGQEKMVTLLETLPKSYTFTVPEVPTEPGLWELSIYAFDGTNTSYEYYFPYYIVNELSGQDDETEPKLVEHPNDGVMKVNQDVKISFEDDTDIYYIAYKWVTEKEESYVKNATMVYHPKNGEITIKAPDIKGRYYLQWFAVDGSRVISTGYFVIIDVRNDVEPPEIKLNGEDPQYIDISEGTYNDPGATAHDIYDNRDVEVTIDTSAVQDALNKKQTGEAKVKFTAKDSENNESTTERTVYVVDYSALKDLVEEIGKLNQADYTEKSWKDFQDKLSKANQMIQNKKSKQEEIEAMEAELEAAKDALSLQTPTIKNVTIVANKDPYKTEGKYYLKSGESITVTFETDTPIDLSQKFTINEIEKNITLTKIGNDNEYKYTFDYTLGENDKEGIISYIIKLTKTMAGKNETEAEISGSKQEIIFDKTAPELQFVDGINQSLTIFVGDNPAIAESDVKDKNQEVIDVEINRNGFDNTKPNTYTITYTAKDKAGNDAINSLSRTIIVKDYIANIKLSNKTNKEYTYGDTINPEEIILDVTMASGDAKEMTLKDLMSEYQGKINVTPDINTKLTDINGVEVTITYTDESKKTQETFTLTINAKSINITIKNRESFYKEKIDLTVKDTDFEITGLSDEDDLKPTAQDLEFYIDGYEDLSSTDLDVNTYVLKGRCNNPNYKVTFTDGSYEVKPIDPTIDDLTNVNLPSNKIYDAIPVQYLPIAKDGIKGLGETITAKFYQETEEGAENATSDLPADAGTYKVIIEVSKGQNYNAKTIEVDGEFTISPVTITKVNWEDYLTRSNFEGEVKTNTWTEEFTWKAETNYKANLELKEKFNLEVNQDVEFTIKYKESKAQDKADSISDVGEYTVTAKVNSGARNFNESEEIEIGTFKVSDKDIPVIEVQGENPEYIDLTDGNVSTYTDSGAEVTDAHDGTFSATASGVTEVQEAISQKTTGEFTITYTATDKAGNPATQKTRTVHVINYSDLKNKINSANDLVESEDYSVEDSAWSNFQTELEKAESMLKNRKDSQKDIDSQIEKLNDAISKLNVKTPKIISVTISADEKNNYKNQGTYYLKSGETITVTIKTDTAINKVTGITINGDKQIDDKILNSDLVAKGENEYSFSFTLTDKNTVEGPINYALSVVKSVEVGEKTEATSDHSQGEEESIIFDKTLPTIVFNQKEGLVIEESGNAKETVYVKDTSYTNSAEEVKASDTYGAVVSVETNNFDINEIGEYEVIYTAKDYAGNEKSITKTVTVKDYVESMNVEIGNEDTTKTNYLYNENLDTEKTTLSVKIAYSGQTKKYTLKQLLDKSDEELSKLEGTFSVDKTLLNTVGQMTIKITYTDGTKSTETEFTVNVGKLSYNIEAIKFEDDTVTYDTEEHKIEIDTTSLENQELPEGLTVSYKYYKNEAQEENKVTGYPVNAGTYIVVAEFSVEDIEHYNIPTIDNATLIINKVKISDENDNKDIYLTYNIPQEPISWDNEEHPATAKLNNTYRGVKTNEEESKINTDVVITVKYKKDGADANENVPKETGNYTVVATINSAENFEASTVTLGSFEIKDDVPPTILLNEPEYEIIDLSSIEIDSYTYSDTYGAKLQDAHDGNDRTATAVDSDIQAINQAIKAKTTGSFEIKYNGQDIAGNEATNSANSEAPIKRMVYLVSYEELKNKIQEARELEESDYTADALESLDSKISELEQKVSENNIKEQANIDSLVTEFEEFLNNLETKTPEIQEDSIKITLSGKEDEKVYIKATSENRIIVEFTTDTAITKITDVNINVKKLEELVLSEEINGENQFKLVKEQEGKFTYQFSLTTEGMNDGFIDCAMTVVKELNGKTTTKSATKENQNIIIDTISPVLSLNSNIDETIFLKDTDKSESYFTSNITTDVTVNDANKDAGIDIKITSWGREEKIFDVNTAGQYTITYTATDKAGNEGTIERTITVKDYVSEIEILEDTKKEYKYNEIINKSDILLKVTMASGIVSDEKITLENFEEKYQGTTTLSLTSNLTTLGNQNVTLTYTDTIKEGYSKVASDEYQINVTRDIQITITSPLTSVYGTSIDLTNLDYTVSPADEPQPAKEDIIFKINGSSKHEKLDANTYTIDCTSNNPNFIVTTVTPNTYIVTKADLDSENPTGLTAIYGQTLADVDLSKFTTEEGSFSWQYDDPNSVKVGNVNPANSFNVKFTPTDDTNYNVKENIPVTIEVTPRPVQVQITESEENNAKLSSQYGDEPKDVTKLEYTWKEKQEPEIFDVLSEDKEALTITFGIKDEQGEISNTTDAGQYDIFVKSCSNDNYTVTVSNGTRKYEITKRNIRINIQKQKMVYGEKFSLNYTLDNFTFIGGNTLSVELYVEKDAKKYDPETMGHLPVGTYTIKSNVVTGGKTDSNYTFDVTEDATLEVKQREITIEISDNQSEKLSSEYGDDLAEFNTLAYEISQSGKYQLAENESKEDLNIEFGLKYKDGTEKEVDSKSNQGKYNIVIKKANSNYDIKIAEKNNEYTISPRTIEITVDDQSGIYEDGLKELTYKKSKEPIADDKITFTPYISLDGSGERYDQQSMGALPVGSHTINVEWNIETGEAQNYNISVTKTGIYTVTQKEQNPFEIYVTENGEKIEEIQESDCKKGTIKITATEVKLYIEEGRIGTPRTEFDIQNIISVDNDTKGITLLKDGTVTITVTYPGDKNHKEVSAKYKLVVEKDVLKATDFELDEDSKAKTEVTYDAEAHSLNVVAKDNISGVTQENIKVLYYKDGAKVADNINPPVNAGTYNVKVSITGSSKYTDITEESPLELTEITLTINTVTINEENKTNYLAYTATTKSLTESEWQEHNKTVELIEKYKTADGKNVTVTPTYKKTGKAGEDVLDGMVPNTPGTYEVSAKIADNRGSEHNFIDTTVVLYNVNIIDITDLNEALNEAEKYKKDDYNEVAWTTFESAKNEAQDAVNNPNELTQDKINELKDALTNAEEGLESEKKEFEKSELEEFKKNHNKDDYSNWEETLGELIQKAEDSTLQSEYLDLMQKIEETAEKLEVIEPKATNIEISASKETQEDKYYLKAGDTITVTFTTNTPIDIEKTQEFIINGRNVSISGLQKLEEGGNYKYKFTYEFSNNDLETETGFITYALKLTKNVDSKEYTTQDPETTTSSDTIFDKTLPQIAFVQKDGLNITDKTANIDVKVGEDYKNSNENGVDVTVTDKNLKTDNPITVSIKVGEQEEEFSTETAGKIFTVTYTAEDKAGNQASVVKTVNIVKHKIDLSELIFENKLNEKYDGSYHKIELSGAIPEGIKNPTYTYQKTEGSLEEQGETNKGVIDAGTYTVTVKFEISETDKYEITGENTKTATLTIAKADLTFNVTDNSFIYNAEERSANVTPNLVDRADEQVDSIDSTITYYEHEKENIATPKDAGIYDIKVKVENDKNYNDYDSKVGELTIKKVQMTDDGEQSKTNYLSYSVKTPVEKGYEEKGNSKDIVSVDLIGKYKSENSDASITITYVATKGDYKEYDEQETKPAGTYTVKVSVEGKNFDENYKVTIGTLEVVSYDELENLISENSNLQEEDYTTDTWEKYDSALEAAKKLISYKEENVATQMEIDSKKSTLEDAIKGLQPKELDKNELEDIVSKFESLHEADFKSTTYKEVKEKIDAVKKLAEAEGTLQSELEKALEEVNLNSLDSEALLKPTIIDDSIDIIALDNGNTNKIQNKDEKYYVKVGDKVKFTFKTNTPVAKSQQITINDKLVTITLEGTTTEDYGQDFVAKEQYDYTAVYTFDESMDMSDGEISYSITLTKTANVISEDSVNTSTIESDSKEVETTGIILDRIAPVIKFVQERGFNVTEEGKKADITILIGESHENSVNDVNVTDANIEADLTQVVNITENDYNSNKAGTYHITYQATDKAGNESETIEKIITVNKKTLELSEKNVTFADKEVDYQKGLKQTLTANNIPEGIKAEYTYYKSANRQKIEQAISESEVENAGEYFVEVRFTIDESNPAGEELANTYDKVVLNGQEVSSAILTIKPIVYQITIENIKFEDTSDGDFTFIYDGTDHEILIDAKTLPEGIEVKSYSGNKEKEAKDSYTATATLGIKSDWADASNYSGISQDTVTQVWKIDKRQITIKIDDEQETLRQSEYGEELASYQNLKTTVQEGKYGKIEEDELNIKFKLQDPENPEDIITSESDAGEYKIVLDETAYNKNYTITLLEENNTYTITPRKVKITAEDNQSSIYGEKVVINSSYTGFNATDARTLTVNAYIELDGEKYPNEEKYLPANENGYDVKFEYKLTGDKESNYEFELPQNIKYIVNKRNVNITIDAGQELNSKYGEELKLSDLRFTIAEETKLAEGEEKEQLAIVFGLKKDEIDSEIFTNGGNVGTYKIVVSSCNPNYDIKVLETNNTYTIDKADGKDNNEYKEPSDLTATYHANKTLKDLVSLPEGWSWSNTDENQVPTVNKSTYFADYTSSNENYEDVKNVELTVTILPREITDNVTVNVNADSKDYDGKPVNVTVDFTTSDDGIDTKELKAGEPIYYKKSNSGYDIRLDSAPTDFGEYKVQYTVTGNENYTGSASGEKEFEIRKTTVTIKINEGQDSILQSTYGEPLNDLTQLDYTIISPKEPTLTKEQLKVKFKLQGESIQNKGTYLVEIDSHDPNYEVTLDPQSSIYYTINPRNITIELESGEDGVAASSVYTSPITLESLKYKVSQDSTLASWDSGKVLSTLLNITFNVQDSKNTEVTSETEVGKYNILIQSYENDNYTVTLNNGTNAYEITPKPINATIDGVQRAYKEQHIDPQVTIAEGELAEKDSKESLNITFKYYNQLPGDDDSSITIDENTPVGKYLIVGQYSNKNYIVTFNKNAYYEITKAKPEVPELHELNATYGQKLQDIEVQLKEIDNGFAFKDPLETSVGDAGTKTFNITYTPSDSNYAEVTEDLTVTVVVAKIDPTKNEITFTPPTKLEYDGEEKEANVSKASGVEGLGIISEPKYYKATRNDDGSLISEGSALEEKPKDAGYYIVKVDIEDGLNYNAVQDLEVGSFQITTKQLNVQNVKIVLPGEAESDYTKYYTGTEKLVKVTLTPDDVQADINIVYKKKDAEGLDYTIEVPQNKPITVGEYQATITITGKGNYSGEPLSYTRTFEIEKATQTLEMKIIKKDDELQNEITEILNTEFPELIITRGQNDEGELKVTVLPDNIVNIEKNQITAITGLGKATITATISESENYEEISVSKTLKVVSEQAAPKVRLSSNEARITDSNPPTFIFDDNIETKNVVYRLSSDSVISITDGKIKLLGTGQVTIYVKYEATDTLKESPETELTLTVNRGKLTAKDFKVRSDDISSTYSTVYNTKPKSAEVSAKVNGIGSNLKVDYYKGESIIENPTDVGEYKIKVSVSDDGTRYEGIENLEIGYLKINPVLVTNANKNDYLTYKLDSDGDGNGEDIWKDQVEWDGKEHKVTVRLNDLYSGITRTEETLDEVQPTINQNVSFTIKYNGKEDIPTNLGQYTVTAEITCPEGGNFTSTTVTLGTFTIRDTTGPEFRTFGVSEGNVINIVKTEFNETFPYAQYVKAYDRNGEEVSITWSDESGINSNPVKTNIVGSYKVVYKATDDQGNISTLTITVIVKNTPPRIGYISKKAESHDFNIELTLEREEEFMQNPLTSLTTITWDRGNAVIYIIEDLNAGKDSEFSEVYFNEEGRLAADLGKTGLYKIVVKDGEEENDTTTRYIKIDIRQPEIEFESKGATEDKTLFTDSVSVKILNANNVLNAYVDVYDAMNSQKLETKYIIQEGSVQDGLQIDEHGILTYVIEKPKETHTYHIYVEGTNKISDTKVIGIIVSN